MKILVTGGAGYIGSHTCKHVAQHGHEVVVYDNLSTGFRELARWGELEHGDIMDQARLRACMARHHVDGVIHFAALSQVGTSVREPGEYYRNNVSGTINLIEAMRLEGVRHIVMSGTAAVYGQPECSPIPESAPANPLNPYGFSKLCMERMLADYEVAHDMRWVSLRYFNAAGADPDGETGEMHAPETHLIPRIFMAAAGQIPALDVFGTDYPTPDGTCIRDYIHVMDLASAHRLAMEHLVNGGASGAFNLGTGQGATVKEVLSAAANACAMPIPLTFGPRRAGDPASLVADATLARQTFGWAPCCSDMNTIMQTAWAWFQKRMVGKDNVQQA